jgi:hypothetical protein
VLIALKLAFQIAFGSQTIFPCFPKGLGETLGFASLPHGRFAFIGAIILKELCPPHDGERFVLQRI